MITSSISGSRFFLGFSAVLVVFVGVFSFASMAQAESLEEELNRAEGTNARTSTSQEADALIEESQIGTGTPGFFGLDPRTATAAQYINAIFRWGGGFVIFMAVAMVTWGGFGYVFSAGKESTIKRSKEMIFGALLAVVLLILTYAILLLIDPRLVQLRQDFGAGDIDAAEFVTNSTPISCETNEDCATAAESKGGVYEICGLVSDDNIDFKPQMECDQGKKQCVLKENSVSAVLEGMGCSDANWEITQQVSCAAGLVSVPITREGFIMTTDRGYRPGPALLSSESKVALAQAVPGGLLENITTSQQLEDIERQTGVDLKKDFYVHHECRPPTQGQRLEVARSAGQSVSSVSCPGNGSLGSFGPDLTASPYVSMQCRSGQAPSLNVEEVEYTCRDGKSYLKKDSFCGSAPAEICGGSGSGISGKRVWSQDPCEPGTTCLATEGVPRIYRCLEPGDGSAESLYDGAIARGGLPGASCDTNSDCKDFDEPVAVCTSDGFEFEDQEAELTCQRGICKLEADSFCGQVSTSCSGVTSSPISYSQYCVDGTSCQTTGSGTSFCR